MPHRAPRHLRFCIVTALVCCMPATADEGELDDRVYGMLVGSVIGDAAGGPVEFQSEDKIGDRLPAFRGRDDVSLGEDDLTELGRRLPLMPYAELRPGLEPYGQWVAEAPAGTCTDDTRHKIVFIDALRLARDAGRREVSGRDLAVAYLGFAKRPEVAASRGWPDLCEEGFREHTKAARWLLGERDPALAAPPARLWNGIGTCCGMMTLPPLAGVHAGRPTRAYQAAYEIAFFDNADGKDINAAIIAGLAYALTQPLPDDAESRYAAWSRVLDTMIKIDPFRYEEIPFMKRHSSQRIESGRRAGREAGSSPAKLYRLIKDRCEHRYGWEAGFLLHQFAALGEFCRGDLAAAMHLALDYGQDTDSIAQVIGAFGGAIQGPRLFPAEMRTTVELRLAEDHSESLREWVGMIRASRNGPHSGRRSRTQSTTQDRSPLQGALRADR